jgi:hypothetical protein
MVRQFFLDDLVTRHVKLGAGQDVIDLEIGEISIIGSPKTRPFFTECIFQAFGHAGYRIGRRCVIKVAGYNIRVRALRGVQFYFYHLGASFDKRRFEFAAEAAGRRHIGWAIVGDAIHVFIILRVETDGLQVHAVDTELAVALFNIDINTCILAGAIDKLYEPVPDDRIF